MEHSSISSPLVKLLAFAIIILGIVLISSNVRGDGRDTAEAIRDNVVRIVAEWESGARHNGFGFIVGQRERDVFIATANHVVRGSAPGEIAKDITISFFQQQGSNYTATLLGTSNTRRDLAVLKIRFPIGLHWQRDVASVTRPKTLTRVWFVGRSGEWYIPAIPGAVNQVDLDDLIIVDGLNVLRGTSGAPLVSENGIVGIIVSDQPGERAHGH